MQTFLMKQSCNVNCQSRPQHILELYEKLSSSKFKFQDARDYRPGHSDIIGLLRTTLNMQDFHLKKLLIARKNFILRKKLKKIRTISKSSGEL